MDCQMMILHEVVVTLSSGYTVRIFAKTPDDSLAKPE